jgi:hypothetical protein
MSGYRTMADAPTMLRRLLADCTESMITGRPLLADVTRSYCTVSIAGQVTRVEREDGSGSRYNVYTADGTCYYCEGGEYCGMVRTVRTAPAPARSRR